MKNYLYTAPPMRKALYVLIFLFGLSGCASISGKTTSSSTPNTSFYGSYYLWLKSLSVEEFQREIKVQQDQSEQGMASAELYLVLLYSVPQSPIYNPYTAKSKLNQLPLEPESAQFSVADFAFIVALKDQLNQQLLVLNKLISNEKVNQEAKSQLAQQKASLVMLEAQLAKLKEQIKQLKNIEKSIDTNG